MLSAITMTASSWKYITDALHACLVGSWVSVSLLRRQAMSVMNEVFKVIPPELLSAEDPRLRFLSRSAAQKLQLLSFLALVLSSNLAVPCADEVYATDACSESGGIFVQLPYLLRLQLCCGGLQFGRRNRCQ